MLKLAFPHRRNGRGAVRRRRTAQDRLRPPGAPIDDDRALGQATQRAVAVGRRTIIEAHGCLQRLRSQHADHPVSPLSVDDRAHLVADITVRLNALHQRLLLLSASVELEIDRLDMMCAEVEQLMGARVGEDTS